MPRVSVTFFEQATPLDVIEASRIGSSTRRRSGKRTLGRPWAILGLLLEQSRFMLPGWYGLGSALVALQGRDSARFETLVTAKREETRWDPCTTSSVTRPPP